MSKSMKRYAALLAGVLLGVVCTTGCRQRSAEAGPHTTQKTFATPEEAGQALQAAARNNNEKALAQILGSDAHAVLSSGDAAEDKAALTTFIAKYDRMNRWVTMTDGSRVLYIGTDNYPYPIPLIQNSSSRWYFDTEAGKNEILARRIGRNELLAIDAVDAMSYAEELYRATGGQYTQLILSTPGQRDGLYWEVLPNEPSSPLGRLNEFANETVTTTLPGVPPVFDGYSFRVLSAQGGQAKDGAKSYVKNGKMTDGFAILATPVTYGDSGIMSFVIGRDGVVYQKDLGVKTAEVAASMNAYNPDRGWTQAE
jgi:Protein of unknown function (DUF2950)